MNSPYFFRCVHKIFYFAALLAVSSTSTTIASQEVSATSSIWIKRHLEKKDQLLCTMEDAGNTFFVSRDSEGKYKTGERIKMGKPGGELQVSTLGWEFRDRTGKHRQEKGNTNSKTVTADLKLSGKDWFWEKLRFPIIDVEELDILHATFRYQVVSEKRERSVSCKIQLAK